MRFLWKAIPKNKNKEIDLLLNVLNKQTYIPRLTFMIYTKKDYFFKDNYSKKFRYFLLKQNLERIYQIERIIFQVQNNSKLGIIVHTKSIDFIKEFLKDKQENVYKQKIIKKFNDLFHDNSFVNKLSGDEDLSIMFWRASQPFGAQVPLKFAIL